MPTQLPALLRSVLYVPGSNQRALEKALGLGADAIIMDLEDSVAPAAKESARENVRAALSQPAPLVRTVRINSLDSPWWYGDLAVAARADAVVIPKVDTSSSLEPVAVRLRDLLATANHHPPLWPMIESPLGVINAHAIASFPGVAALILGTSDLTKGLRLRLTGSRQPLHTALQQTILAARAANVAVVDGVYVDIKDHAGFAEQCQEGARLGFDGKTVIHPSQIAPANAAFLPSAEEIAHAREVIATWAAAHQRGDEICLYQGKLVERLHALEAHRLIELWELARSTVTE